MESKRQGDLGSYGGLIEGIRIKKMLLQKKHFSRDCASYQLIGCGASEEGGIVSFYNKEQ